MLREVEQCLGQDLDHRRGLLVGNARGKRSVYLYERSGKEPSFVVKIPHSDIGQRQCDREARGLEQFASLEVPDVEFPRLAGSFLYGRYRCYVQRAVNGQLWLGKLPVVGLRFRRAHFEKATDALVRIYRNSVQRDSEEETKCGRCFQHGDFWVGNVGSNGRGVVLYDFEYAQPMGSPLHDLMHFSLYYVVARRNAGKVGVEVVKGEYTRENDQRRFAPDREDVRAILRGGPYQGVVRSCVKTYCDACSISADDARLLIKGYVVGDRGIEDLPKHWEDALV